MARLALEDVLVHSNELDDPRSSVNRHHPLPMVIMVVLLAVFLGADGPTAIRVRAGART